MEKLPCVYLLSSSRNGTLYLGVTSNLVGRVWQHREHVVVGFSDHHDATRLVWFEMHQTMESAITREKRLRSGGAPGRSGLSRSAIPIGTTCGLKS